MKKKRTKLSEVFEDLYFNEKKTSKILINEISTLSVFPIHDPNLYRAINYLADYFQIDVKKLVEKIVHDQTLIINNILDESKVISNFYVELLTSLVINDIRSEMLYMVKIIALDHSHEQISGILISYNKAGIIINEKSIRSHIISQSLALTFPFLLLKKNNSKWLQEYFKLYKSSENHTPNFNAKITRGSNEYYLARALEFKMKMKRENKKSNFTNYANFIGEKRTTLSDKLNRKGIYKQICSILKNDGKMTK